LVAWLLAVVLSLDLGGVGLFLSPPSLHGGGQEEKKLDGVVIMNSMEGQSGAAVLPRANHMATKLVAVILGQKGDPSSTSSSEALLFICWKTTPTEGQVVRPRSSSS
jgi:hypothetical protein